MTQPRQNMYVACCSGMMGSASVSAILANGASAQDILTRTHAEPDLYNRAPV